MLDHGFIRSFSGLLQTAYGSSDWFDHVGPTLTESIRSGHRSLADLNIDLIHRICRLLGLEPRTIRSSEIETTGVRSTRIANLLRNVGARAYLAAPGAAAYMAADDVFPLPDVATHFQNYLPEPYPQRHAEEFVPRLSVVDALFQVGPERTLEVVRAGARGFIPWSEMPAGRGQE
jgi:hypothetical protein